MAAAKKLLEFGVEKGKKGFTGLANMLGRGSTRPPATTAADELTLFPGSPMFPGTPATRPSGFLGDVRTARGQTRSRIQSKRDARAAEGRVSLPARVIGGTLARPGMLLTGAGLAGLGGYATLGDSFGGAQGPEVSLADIEAKTEQERYLDRMQALIDQSYTQDPAFELKRANQARIAADRAAAAYEEMGRPDLAEGARQEVMNRYNQLLMAEQADLAQQRREALGIVREQAFELPNIVTPPSELRDLATSFANDYYSLSQEDRDYYAQNGIPNVTAYVQGKINGEI